MNIFVVRAFNREKVPDHDHWNRTYIVFAPDQAEAVRLVKEGFSNEGHQSYRVDEGTPLVNIDHAQVSGYIDPVRSIPI